MLSPVRLLSPTLPSMLSTLPPFTIKLSFALPPIRVWIFEKTPMPLTSPALAAVIFQVLAILSPARLLSPTLPSMLATLPPFRVKLSSKLPPFRVWIFEKVLTPLMSPALAAVMFQVLAMLSPVRLLSPVLPSMLTMLPPFRVKLSSKLPPFRVWILEKAPTPLTSPALAAVIFQVLAMLSPVRLLSPTLPSTLAMLPPFTTKLSFALPPFRFWILEKAPTPLTSPALAAVMFQVLAMLSPARLLSPVLPSMLATLPPLRVKLSFALPPFRC